MALTQIPGSMISADAALPTGAGPISFIGTSAPSGWVLAAGRTIGNAASGATERAHADTQPLFLLLWNSLTNTEAPVSGGRGASAAADFAANKTIAVPDLRGRVTAGKDDMGGAAANRMTTGGSGVDGSRLGATGGAETHTLTTAQMPAHTHQVGDPAGGTGAASGGGKWFAGTSTTATTTASRGGDGAHNNTQPTIITNMIIKL